VAFLRNSAVNLLNVHYGLHAVAMSGGGAFFTVYLLKVGLSIPGVLVSLALILLGRFLVRPVVIGLSVRWGLRRMVMAGTLLAALEYPFLRAVATDNAALAILANALGALGVCLYIPTLMTAVYNQSKGSPCPLRFQVATEGGWDIGGASGSLVAALLIALGVPLWGSLLLSLVGVAAGFVVLRGYYASRGKSIAGTDIASETGR
jgi:hypothetical protein